MGVSLRVLNVEDSQADAHLLQRHLAYQGYDLTFVRVDSKNALEVTLKDSDWDVVLCDYTLPGFSVNEAMTAVRERDPDLPFIIVSGIVGEEAAVEAMRAGAHDYVMKDRLGRLAAAIDREVREASNRRDRRRSEERERQAERRQSLLAAASKSLTSSLDPGVILSDITQLVVPYLADMCAFHLTEGDPKPWVTHANSAGEELAREIFRGLPSAQAGPRGYHQVLSTGQPYLVSDFLNETLGESAGTYETMYQRTGNGLRSYMILPLTARDRTQGIMFLAITQSGRRYVTEDLQIAEDLAARIALALDNARLYGEKSQLVTQLGETAALLDAILETAPIGFAFIDTESRFKRINPVMADIYGDPAETRIGRTLREALQEPLEQDTEEIVKRVLKTGAPVRNQEMAGKNSSLPGARHWMVNYYPVRRSNGKITGIGVLAADITERKVAEQALRANESLLDSQRAILEMVAVGAPLSQVLNKIALLVEQQIGDCHCCIHMVEGAGTSLRQHAAPTLPPSFSNQINQTAYGESITSAAVQRNELIVSANVIGDPFWKRVYEQAALYHGIRAAWACPVRDSTGQSTGAITVYSPSATEPTTNDVRLTRIAGHLTSLAVERHQLEEGIARKLESLLQHMSEGVIACDQEETLLFANATASQLLDPLNLSGRKRIRSLILPSNLVDAMARACTPQVTTTERVLLRLRERDFEAHVSPVYSDTHRYGAIAVLQDITAQLEYRRLQERFVSNVSHELRGPLATLSATLEAFADGIIPDQERGRYLKSMLGEMQRLRRLSSEVIDLTRLDSGMAVLKVEPCPLMLLLEQLRYQFAQSYASAGVILDVDTSDLTVAADYDRVHECLNNLLDNALRHTPRGGTVRVYVRAEGDFAKLFITDNGDGIPAEHLQHIWGRFYKVDQARTIRADGGTGLGLSLVKQLVELMGGQVDVQSNHAGSTFSFTIPRWQPKLKQAQSHNLCQN